MTSQLLFASPKRGDGLLVISQDGMAVCFVQIGLFQLRGSRQNDVRVIGRVGQEQFMHDGK